MKTKKAFEYRNVYGNPEFILYGADPEGMLVAGNGYLRADNVIYPQHFDGLGEVGLDGNPYTLEVRPEPDTDPLKLYDKIVSLYMEAIDESGAYGVDLTSRFEPTGCHIHVGYDGAEVVHCSENSERFIENIGRTGDILYRLNGHRECTCYGRKIGFSLKSHGLEYRTPPAIIVARPDLFVWACKRAMAAARGEALPIMTRSARYAYLELRDILRQGVAYGLRYDGQFVELGDVRKYFEDEEEPEPDYQIYYHDDWDSGVRGMFSAALWDLYLTSDITLFGYREDRGMVCNVREIVDDIPELEYIDDQRSWNMIGLPRAVRMGQVDEELIVRIIGAVYDYLYNVL